LEVCFFAPEVYYVAFVETDLAEHLGFAKYRGSAHGLERIAAQFDTGINLDGAGINSRALHSIHALHNLRFGLVFHAEDIAAAHQVGAGVLQVGQQYFEKAGLQFQIVFGDKNILAFGSVDAAVLGKGNAPVYAIIKESNLWRILDQVPEVILRSVGAAVNNYNNFQNFRLAKVIRQNLLKKAQTVFGRNNN
jgi:hypothetical protein